MLLTKVGFMATVSLAVCGFTATATTAATLPFSADYSILATAIPLTPDVQQISITAQSFNAPYGLSLSNSLSYSQTNFLTGSFTSDSNPSVFGLSGQPQGITVFSSPNEVDKLFAVQSGTGVINFETLTVTSSSTITITGGEGKFAGATGTLFGVQTQPFDIQLGTALEGQATITGTIEVIPEPLTVLGAGVAIALGTLFKRQLKR